MSIDLDPSRLPPILRDKAYDQPSAFTPGNLLREARRQKGLAEGTVPAICVLDPDGDIVRTLMAGGSAAKDPSWACYHTELFRFQQDGVTFGIVGGAIGSSFAVLVAEQLFASGCRLLISVTSSGQIARVGTPPYFVLIEKALRDEGTSYHYLPPSEFASLQPHLRERLAGAFDALPVTVDAGATWTTDAPYRETETAIEKARAAGILAVEMEAAALYAFAEAKRYPVVCLAHVTNQMATIEGDFEKGEAGGSRHALQVIGAVAGAVEVHRGSVQPKRA
jgi:uridine phosphorylase